MSKLWQCTICEEKFTEEDYRNLKYFPSTGICSKCYDEAKKDSSVCFAKKPEYSKHSLVCSKICADRKICKLYLRVARYEA